MKNTMLIVSLLVTVSVIANDNCPKFKSQYSQCETTFSSDFPVEVNTIDVIDLDGKGWNFKVVAGERVMENLIYPDGIVRFTYEIEDGVKLPTHTSARCEKGALKVHDISFPYNELPIQEELEFVTFNEQLNFSMFENGRLQFTINCK